jgi:hypothetical protein
MEAAIPNVFANGHFRLEEAKGQVFYTVGLVKDIGKHGMQWRHRRLNQLPSQVEGRLWSEAVG